jgi:hypothetical protein
MLSFIVKKDNAPKPAYGQRKPLAFLFHDQASKGSYFQHLGPNIFARGGQQHTTSLGCKPLNILRQIHRLNLCKIENLIQSKGYQKYLGKRSNMLFS